jgi:hypothetical protein
LTKNTLAHGVTMSDAYMGSVRLRGMLDSDVMLLLRPMTISKVAFMAGSSRQGKTCRAAVGSI